MCAEPIRSRRDNWYVETGAGSAKEQSIGDPEVPHLSDDSGHQGTYDEGSDAYHDDFSSTVTVCAVSTHWCQKRAGDAGQGIGHGNHCWVPSVSFL